MVNKSIVNLTVWNKRCSLKEHTHCLSFTKHLCLKSKHYPGQVFPSKHLDLVSHILSALCSVSAVLGYRVTLTTGSRRVYVGHQTPDRQSEGSLASHWSLWHNTGLSLAEAGHTRHQDNDRTWVTLISDGDKRPGRSMVHPTVWWTMLYLCFGLWENELRYFRALVCVCIASQLRDNVDSYWCLRQCEQWPGETPLVRRVAP